MSEVIIKVDELVKTYGDMNAVDNVSFEVKKGEIFSLLGPNGAGKTTTVEIMEGLRTPTSGKVTIFDTDVTKDYSPIRSRVGVLPQNFDPFERLKVSESIEYFGGLFSKEMTKENVSSLAELVGLEDKLNVVARKLSGGQKRKLGIALALVGDPELLFLDEPTTGLDAQARRNLWKVLEELKENGKTIILTTHYLDEAEKLSDNILIVEKGKEIAQGNPKQLIDEHGGGKVLILRKCNGDTVSELEKMGYKAESDGEDIRIYIDGKSSIVSIAKEIEEKGIEFNDFATQDPNLEDAFINLIGGTIVEGEIKK